MMTHLLVCTCGGYSGDGRFSMELYFRGVASLFQVLFGTVMIWACFAYMIGFYTSSAVIAKATAVIIHYWKDNIILTDNVHHT
jgi:hypothetical protein